MAGALNRLHAADCVSSVCKILDTVIDMDTLVFIDTSLFICARDADTSRIPLQRHLDHACVP